MVVHRARWKAGRSAVTLRIGHTPIENRLITSTAESFHLCLAHILLAGTTDF
jgi:hypothetical protein